MMSPTARSGGGAYVLHINQLSSILLVCHVLSATSKIQELWGLMIPGIFGLMDCFAYS